MLGPPVCPSFALFSVLFIRRNWLWCAYKTRVWRAYNMHLPHTPKPTKVHFCNPKLQFHILFSISTQIEKLNWNVKAFNIQFWLVHNPNTNRESKGDRMMICASAVRVRIWKEQSDEVKYNAWRLEGGSRKWVFMGHNKLLMPVLPSAADSDLMQIRRMQVECRQ